MNEPKTIAETDGERGGVLGAIVGLGVVVLVFAAVFILAMNYVQSSSALGVPISLAPLFNILIPLTINGLLMWWARRTGRKGFFKGLLIVTLLDFLIASACAGSFISGGYP